MTPFNQALRLWLRRAPLAERAFAACAAMLACALLAWAAVPVDRVVATEAGAQNPGDAPQASAPATSSPVAPGSLPPGATAVPQPGRSVTSAGPMTPSQVGHPPAISAPNGPQGCPKGTDQGVTSTEMRVAFSLIDIGGQAGNNTFGIPSADEQRSDYELLTKAVNDAGGICGRKVVSKYYPVSGFDTSAPHKACLEITADKPFFVFDTAAIGVNEAACFAQHKTPFMSTGVTSQDARQYYPYVNSPISYDLIYRNAVFAWKQRGAFDVGGKLGKIGVIFHSCFPLYQKVMFQAFRDAGIPDNRLSIFDFGDCNGFASPSTHQQAILKFQNEGVTHVFVGFMSADFSNFTKMAQQQGFKPQYRIADPGTLAVAYGSLAPDWNNIDGALAITQGRFGEEHTAGYTPSAATQRCDAIFKRAGRPATYQQPIGWGGFACFYLWSLQAAVEHAPVMSRLGVAQGFGIVRVVPDPYPFGPSGYEPGQLWSGRSWREIKASASCRCYRLNMRDFQPSFP